MQFCQSWVGAHPTSVPEDHGPGPAASWRHSHVAQLSHGAASRAQDRAQDGRTNPRSLGWGQGMEQLGSNAGHGKKFKKKKKKRGRWAQGDGDEPAASGSRQPPLRLPRSDSGNSRPLV